MLEAINFFTTKLWFWYAKRIMKWNWLLVTKNKEQTEIISLVFCNNADLGKNIENTLNNFVIDRDI